MPSEPALLERIAALARFGRYRVRLHAVRHMLEEGFDERDIIEVLTGRRRKILEEYPEQNRCLILGSFAVGRKSRIHLHLYSASAVVDYAIQTWEKAMMNLARKPCSECGGRLRPRKISQEFEREGVRIRLAGIQAWVCSRCGEIYFLPGGAGRLAKAARSLFDLALAGRQHRGRLTGRIS